MACHAMLKNMARGTQVEKTEVVGRAEVFVVTEARGPRF